jgi:surfeit locus 1 family protein
VLDATVFALAGIVILTGLGLWQLDRKVWKERLIEATTTRLAAPPTALPPREQWSSLKQDSDEFRRVTLPAEFVNDKEAFVYNAGSALRPDIKEQGFWVFTPARLPGGSVIVINRGFVPNDRKAPTNRPEGQIGGLIDIVGVLRWPEPRGLFTPADDTNNSVWYVRDPNAMAQAKGWGAIAPFYIEQEGPLPPGGLPRAGRLTVALPDNHLQYALTWFGLAIVLAGVYVTWLVGRFRRA